MGTFKIGDLAVSMNAKDKLFCPIHTPLCLHACSFVISCVHYTPHGCPFYTCYHACSIIISNPCRFTFLERPDFGEVEFNQLKAEMAELQKGFDAEFKPKTMEDLNELEGSLTKALAQIKEQKADFKK